MKSLMLLWKEVLDESGTWCHTSTTRDYKTASRRFEHEGLSFLTITLSNFGKDFERSLDVGVVAHDSFAGFARTKGLPRFLSGFLAQVFEIESGLLLDEPSLTAIRAIRQLTLMFGKVNLSCTTSRKDAAIEAFIKCESELETVDASLSGPNIRAFADVSNLLFGQLFGKWDREIRNHNLMPKHGPGATADGLRGNSKWRQSTWHQRLETVFPMVEFLLPTYGYWRELDDVTVLEPGEERPVKVTLVPKTLKTPRIIAIEPTCMQYAQQAMLAAFLGKFYEDDFLQNFIGFDDQSPNRDLARLGSSYGELATLDLSEASDRVSNKLVKIMTSKYLHVSEGVQASRSTRAELPDGSVIRLRKFASMGSALCFPVEAMVFLTCIFIGIGNELSRTVDRELCEEFIGRVRVYGDDMIVPVEMVNSVVSTLELYGFKVNKNKSFWNGKFRESCGGDYFSGQDVTPVRVRSVLPEQRRHNAEIISTIAFRNNLYEKGYRNSCEWLDKVIMRYLSHYPRVRPTSAVLGRHDDTGYDTGRHCSDLQKPLVKGYVVSPRLPVSRVWGKYALLKFLCTRSGFPLGLGHLERAGRPAVVDIKLRWASPV